MFNLVETRIETEFRIILLLFKTILSDHSSLNEWIGRRTVKALEARELKERCTDHDLRAKTGSDAELEHATRLLAHLDAKVTRKYYRRKVPVVRPLM